MRLKFLQALLYSILDQPYHHTWTIQGFGMLRTNILVGGNDFRVNVWDSDFRVPNVSMIHTHPWNFTSIILCGVVSNIRYSRAVAKRTTQPLRMLRSDIKPGPGGGLRSNPAAEVLHVLPAEILSAGHTYYQEHNEIHQTQASIGSVTLNFRERVGADMASVYWPVGTEWVSAEPRIAARDEIAVITQRARSVLESEMR